MRPGEEFWTHVAVVQSASDLECSRTAIKPGLMAADQGFLAALAQHPEYSFDLAEASPMTAPTLIVAGRQDSATGYRDVLEIVELFPRATLAVLDRAGHGLRSEQESLFTPLTHELIDRREESARA